MEEVVINLIIYGFIILVAFINIENKKKLAEKNKKSVETLNIQQTIEIEKTNSKKASDESYNQLVDSNDEIKSDYVDTLGFNKDDISQQEFHAHDGLDEVEKLIDENNNNPIKEYK